MCTGLFSCMDQKHVLLDNNLSRLEQLLEQQWRRQQAASTILTLTDTIARILSESLETTGAHGTELKESAENLYDAAGTLFDNPSQPRYWYDVRRHCNQTRQIFSDELDQLRQRCASAGVSVAMNQR